MTDIDALAAFWDHARRALDLAADAPVPDAWRFGDSPQMADELLALVLAGTKRATAGSLWDHEAEDEPLPRVGELSIVLDGAGRPACVIEITEVSVMPMSEVDAEFAYDEGEGDRTLEWWRQVHESFFRRLMPKIGRTFAPDMPLVLQRFALRYAEP